MPKPILDELLDHVSEDAPVRELRVCSFFTAVVSRGAGLASTLRGVARCGGTAPPVSAAGDLLPSSALELARLARSERLLEASIGLASLNSLVNAGTLGTVDENAGHLLARNGRDRRVVVVGDFPFVKRLQDVTADLWVFDQGRSRAAGVQRTELMSQLLPRAQVAAITSTALLNHTLDGIMELLPEDCYTLLVGPSTPLTPRLFDLGFDALCGSVVDDPERALACLSQGATFRQVRGIRHVTAVATEQP